MAGFRSDASRKIGPKIVVWFIYSRSSVDHHVSALVTVSLFGSIITDRTISSGFIDNLCFFIRSALITKRKRG